ncbi:MAG: universal stress protein [Frankiales bacterium]|nr:universal stress protein [Frankiales bacterium]
MSIPDRTVVVGVRGSAASRTALRHAATAAAERGATVTVLHSYAIPALLADGGVWLSMDDMADVEAAVLQDAVDQLAELAPTLHVIPRLEQNEPARSLVEASQEADLVVVGRSVGHHSWLGPVLSHLCADGGCPVLSVTEGQPVRYGDVVVGVDGSEVSLQAVAYGFEQAARWQVPLVAVLSLHGGFDAYVPAARLLDLMHERGRKELAESLAGWCEKYPDIQVHQIVTFTEPVAALREAGQDAGVIVVGSNGRGAVGRAFVGSVSSSLLRQAPCPVAVVRAG